MALLQGPAQSWLRLGTAQPRNAKKIGLQQREKKEKKIIIKKMLLIYHLLVRDSSWLITKPRSFCRQHFIDSSEPVPSSQPDLSLVSLTTKTHHLQPR